MREATPSPANVQPATLSTLALVICRLTVEFSGQPRRPFRPGEHAIYGEHGTAWMGHVDLDPIQ
jgi:hypothetical protein